MLLEWRVREVQQFSTLGALNFGPLAAVTVVGSKKYVFKVFPKTKVVAFTYDPR